MNEKTQKYIEWAGKNKWFVLAVVAVAVYFLTHRYEHLINGYVFNTWTGEAVDAFRNQR